MESINIFQVRDVITAAKSKIAIAREIGNEKMIEEAQESVINALGRLVVSTPFLAEIICAQIGQKVYSQ